MQPRAEKCESRHSERYVSETWLYKQQGQHAIVLTLPK